MSTLLAGFRCQPDFEHAVDRLRAERVDVLETYAPLQPEEGPTGSKLPLIMFAAGMTGFLGFFALMTYADVIAYPLDIGGRPAFAWPTFVPIAFELGVLCAMVAGFVGFFVCCRLPHLYDPVDECAAFQRASRDGFFVAIRSGDADDRRLRALVHSLHPVSIEEFAE